MNYFLSFLVAKKYIGNAKIATNIIVNKKETILKVSTNMAKITFINIKATMTEIINTKMFLNIKTSF